jgi:hypothetical protein
VAAVPLWARSPAIVKSAMAGVAAAQPSPLPPPPSPPPTPPPPPPPPPPQQHQQRVPAQPSEADGLGRAAAADARVDPQRRNRLVETAEEAAETVQVRPGMDGNRLAVGSIRG